MPEIVVTTEQDNIDTADGLSSLREAIVLANASSGSDEITFAADVDLITLESALPTITDDLTIQGGPGVTLDANADGDGDAATQLGPSSADFAARRALEVVGAGTDVVIEGLTITGGYTTGPGGPNGGAGIKLASDTTLTLVNSEVSGTTTAGDRAFGGGANAGGRTRVSYSGDTVASACGARPLQRRAEDAPLPVLLRHRRFISSEAFRVKRCPEPKRPWAPPGRVDCARSQEQSDAPAAFGARNRRRRCRARVS